MTPQNQISSSPYEAIKNAIALVKAGEARGTGYLLAPGIIVTCAHVVGHNSQGTQVGWEIGEQQGDAIVEAVDAVADCAVLRLAQPLDNAKPLPLAARGFKRGDTWEGYGYPALTNGAGHWLTGDVQETNGKDPSGRESVVLYAREIAAADGASPQGFSGSPVLVSGQVVGHLKRIIPNPKDYDAPRAMMGTLYACPAEVVRQMLPHDMAEQLQLAPQPPTVGYDRAWYVRRQAGKFALSQMEFPGTPVVLWGPFRSGKTTLLQRILDKAGRQPTPKTIARINLGLYDQETLATLDAMLKEMAFQLAEEVGTDPDAVERVWQGLSSPVKKMGNFMVKHLLPNVPGNLVLAIDKADQIWRQGFKNDFFGMLRKWAQSAADGNAAKRQLWAKLRLVLVVSSSPTSLIDDPNLSPFNLSDPIELDDLSHAQAGELTQKYGLVWSDEELGRVVDLMGGQPYLLRALMYHARITGQGLNVLLRHDALHRNYANYFTRYRHWLRQNQVLKQELERYLSGESQKPHDLEACYKLERAGLLREDESRVGWYRLRYGLYRYLFN